MKERLNILIADDSEMNCQLFGALIKSFGHNCTTASNGKQACEFAMAEYFDMVFMDIEMPVMDGKEALNLLKNSQYFSNPVIALTAHKDSKVLHNLINFGFNDCLIKPFKKEDLKNIILKHKKDIPNEPSDFKNNIGTELFNLNYLEELAEGDNIFLQNMIETFIGLVPIAIENMKKSLKEEDYKALHLESHKFVTPLNFLGATKTAGYVSTIEKYSKSMIYTGEIGPLIKLIEIDCEHIISKLRLKYNL